MGELKETEKNNLRICVRKSIGSNFEGASRNRFQNVVPYFLFISYVHTLCFISLMGIYQVKKLSNMSKLLLPIL